MSKWGGGGGKWEPRERMGMKEMNWNGIWLPDERIHCIWHLRDHACLPKRARAFICNSKVKADCRFTSTHNREPSSDSAIRIIRQQKTFCVSDARHWNLISTPSTAEKMSKYFAKNFARNHSLFKEKKTHIAFQFSNYAIVLLSNGNRKPLFRPSILIFA